MKKNYKIKQGDSLKLIKTIPDGSVDFILTDPPYNLGVYSSGDLKFKWRKDINNRIADWDLSDFNPSEWLSEFKRILSPKGNIFTFTSHNLLGKWHQAFHEKFDKNTFMVWKKTNPMPKFFKKDFLGACELIYCCWNKGHTWNFDSQKTMHNFFESPICMGSERLKSPHHPTQKPTKILKRMIEIASNEGDVVFDPFMGVGSTGVATLEMNRKFIGFELEKTYFDAAKLRIENAKPQLK